MKHPLSWLTLVFCAGIAAQEMIKAAFQPIYLSALIFLLFSFLFRKKAAAFHVFIFCSIFFLGASLLSNYVFLRKCHILRCVYPEKNNVYLIKGVIVEELSFKHDKSSFVFKTEEVQFEGIKYSTCGNILVHITGRQDLRYGDWLVLAGSLHTPYKDYLRKQGIFYIMRVRSKSEIVKLSGNRGAMPKRLALWLKGKMGQIISKYTSSTTASILEAMILGEQKGVPEPIYNSMMLAGTVHILVVSGFNVSLVAFIVMLLLKLIRFPRQMRFYIAIPLLGIYCLVTGASNPVVRSTVMSVFFMLGCIIKREPEIYNSLSLAAIFILATNPLQLFEIGFQLSFASVFSIVCLYPKIKSLLRIGSLKLTYLRCLIDGCLVSLSAWLGTMGIVVYYFKLFSPITVLANIFVVPLAALITLCGLGLISAGLICPPAAPLFASNCELLTNLLVRINVVLSKIPGAAFRL